MKLRPGVLISDRYEIQDRIGAGGMAIVYKAIDKKLGRVVTLKIMREEYISDKEFINRFNTEAQAAANLNHPNIVKVYDVGRMDNIYYIVMEYINGITLKDAIQSRGQFSNEETLGVAIQIASAMEHAHANNIIHRDIKPQNILITSKGEVKVTDFGIARATDNNTKTSANDTLGSVHYFSPEQARGGYVDHKSDIYSLGITMYEMVTGTLPFEDDTVVAIALKHINDPLPSLDGYDASDSLKKIIMKCTDKLQSQRYDSTTELANDLKRALTNSSGSFVEHDVDNSMTQTLKISETDMKKIREDFYDYNSSDLDNAYDSAYDSVENFGLNEKVEDNGISNKKIVIFAILTGIVISIFIGFFIYFKLFNKPDMVEVPNLVGMTLEEAMQFGDDNGVIIQVGREEENEEYPENVIIDQDYEEGQEINEGETIRVVVSTGMEKVEIPNVVGMTTEEAYREFNGIDLKVKEVFVTNSEFERGIIVQQSPNAKEEVSAGSQVTFYVSKGEETKETTVPNVMGMNETEARGLIQTSHLEVGKVDYVDSSEDNDGKVVYQGLGAGVQIDEGTAINLSVGKYKEETTNDNKDDEDKPQDDTTNGNSTDNNGTSGEDVSQPVTKTLKIDNISIPTGYETVNVRMIQISPDGNNKEVYNQTVSVDDLPIQISVTGTGVVEYQVYINYDGESKLHGSKIVDFSEGGN